MRACQPSHDGYVEREGVKVHYEVFGAGDPTVMLLPTWSLFNSRHWKLQVPDLAHRHRVVVFDGRGNGRSGRPAGAEAYRPAEFTADALAVMDATGTERAVLVALSLGSTWALELGALHPERVAGIVFIGPALPLVPMSKDRLAYSFTKPLDTTDGWAKFNQHYWREHYRDFVEFFVGQIFTEPHSTKPIEDGVGWGLETDPETLIATQLGPRVHGGPVFDPEGAAELAGRLRCPVLVVHGDEDAVRPWAVGARLAELAGGTLATIEGGGHAPHVRDPVRFNLLLREFIGSLAPPPAAQERNSPGGARSRTWTRALRRPRRALYVSSPIGLGHARRDVAIARELRRLVPDLEIDWLAQHPVTRVLETEGERVHPASALLANESAHIESEATGHDLHAFQAIRRMDEILLANFMVFHDVVADGHHDLVVGDEAWDVDHFLHENPELKRTAFAWMTDFVGWLPMPGGGDREGLLTADYNAEMVEHVARFPRLRDRAIFVGNPDDVVPDRFGPGLPAIRDWTREHYDFAGYVTGFDPAGLADRGRLRAELGYRPDEQVCVVTVGGSGVGGPLLRKVMAAYPLARRAVPGLRMVVVAGPRIDPAGLPAHDGLEVHAYVPELYRHLAACDLAVVQGGLTTCMELTALRRPFLYFPLRNHFEQNFHVAHRLDRYRAGRRMDYAASDPDLIADAIATELGRVVDYRPVETDGARRAAEKLAELL
jgi:pimeloyl-ACP methyl ester carboxylesterase/predicted glycosyltransferase